MPNLSIKVFNDVGLKDEDLTCWIMVRREDERQGKWEEEMLRDAEKAVQVAWDMAKMEEPEARFESWDLKVELPWKSDETFGQLMVLPMN